MSKVTIIRTENDDMLKAEGIYLDKLTAGAVQQEILKMPVTEDWAKPMTAILDRYKDKIESANVVEDTGDKYAFLIVYKDNSGIILTIYRNKLNIGTQLVWEVAHGQQH